MTKPKSVRVWVAVEGDGEPMGNTTARLRRSVSEELTNNLFGDDGWRKYGITIRRATLTLDPVKPKKRRKA